MEMSVSVEKIVKLSEDYLGIIAGNKLYCFNRKSECFTPVISGKETDGVRLWGLLPLNETSFWAIFEDKLLLYQWKEHKDQSGDAGFICADLQKDFKLLSAKGEFFLLFALMKIEGCVWLPISVTCCYFIRIVRSCAGR